MKGRQVYLEKKKKKDKYTDTLIIPAWKGAH